MQNPTWPAALSGSAAPASSTPWSQRKNHWMWMDGDTKILDFWPTQWDKYETYMAYIWGTYIYIIIYVYIYIDQLYILDITYDWETTWIPVINGWIEKKICRKPRFYCRTWKVFCEISLQPFLGRQGGGLIFYDQSWRSHDIFHHANMLGWISLIFHPSTEIKGTIWTILIRCQP